MCALQLALATHSQAADQSNVVSTQRRHWLPAARRSAYLPSPRGSSSLVVVMAAGAEGPRRTVLWFRNDLRVHDSATVHEAAQLVKAGKSDEVHRPPCGTGSTPVQSGLLHTFKTQTAKGMWSREVGRRPAFHAQPDVPLLPREVIVFD